MNTINTGDTAFMMVSSALVMFMTIGLAIFYAGMVRTKNVLGTIMQSFIMLGVISVEWILWGYSMSFGPDVGGIIGGLNWFGLNTVGLMPNPDYAPTIPHQLFMIYQCMFAVITPALITGAFAERMRFGPFLLFSLLWATFIYNPVAHWIWGKGGWLREMGVMDFAGGLVVHLNSGAAALATCIVLGKRKGYGSSIIQPHNLTMTLLGAGILWFGWFGFNAGSALSSGALAVNAFITTHLAAATGALSWIAIEWKMTGKPTTLGAGSGAIAGLATITPASGFVSPLAGALIGIIAGILCYVGVMAKNRFNYDDSLDVVGIHGVGGLIGALCAGIFASSVINPAAGNGLLGGNPKQLFIQFLASGIVFIYGFIGSFIILKVVDKFWSLRISEDEELKGLDVTQHSETAYSLF